MPNGELLFLYINASYNPLERREACKGAKEVNKRSATSHTAAKNASTAPKHAPHSARRNDVPHVSSTNQSGKVSRPSSSGGASTYSETDRAAHEQQVVLKDQRWFCLND